MYSLTESQKAILRVFVEHVRTDGRPGDDLWITWVEPERIFIQDFDGNPPLVSKNVLDIFVGEGLMRYRQLTSDQYICTLREKAYRAVDTNFATIKLAKEIPNPMTDNELRNRLLKVYYDQRREEIVQLFPNYFDFDISEGEIARISRQLHDLNQVDFKTVQDEEGTLLKWTGSITARGIDVVEAMLTESERSLTEIIIPPEIQDSLTQFKNDYPDPAKVAFIMMQFGNTSIHKKIVEGIHAALAPYGITAL